MADRGKAVVMPETSRVQRWREDKRQQGLKAVTVWLTQEEALRLKDVALPWPSSRHRRRLVSVLQQTCHRSVSLSGQSSARCKPKRLLLQILLQRSLQIRWHAICQVWCVSLWKGWH